MHTIVSRSRRWIKVMYFLLAFSPLSAGTFTDISQGLFQATTWHILNMSKLAVKRTFVTRIYCLILGRLCCRCNGEVSLSLLYKFIVSCAWLNWILQKNNVDIAITESTINRFGLHEFFAFILCICRSPKMIQNHPSTQSRCIVQDRQSSHTE